jgi:hypothetical protein
MAIEAAVREMLLNDPLGLVSLYLVALGTRNQSTGLPSYTYEVQNVERSAVSGHWQADVEIRSIADSVDDALALNGYAESALVLGTYDGTVITAILNNGRTVDPPNVGEGDEREPAEAVLRLTIHYKD